MQVVMLLVLRLLVLVLLLLLLGQIQEPVAVVAESANDAHLSSPWRTSFHPLNHRWPTGRRRSRCTPCTDTRRCRGNGGCQNIRIAASSGLPRHCTAGTHRCRTVNVPWLRKILTALLSPCSHRTQLILPHVHWNLHACQDRGLVASSSTAVVARPSIKEWLGGRWRTTPENHTTVRHVATVRVCVLLLLLCRHRALPGRCCPRRIVLGRRG